MLAKRLVLLNAVIAAAILVSVGGAFAQASGKSIGLAVEEARAAGIPEATVSGLLALGYEKQIDSVSMANLLSTLTQAQKEGIPLDPFLSKIEEGAIKRVPATVIEQVVAKKLDDYRTVRSLVSDYTKRYGQQAPIPPEHLVRLTETLYCGLSREEVSQVLESAPPTSLPNLTRGVEVLALLKQAKFDAALSRQIVSVGLKQNYFTPEQKDFARAVSVARGKGVPDAQIGAAALATIDAGRSTADLCSQLGVSSQDMGHHGPQVGGAHSGRGMGGWGGMGRSGQHGGKHGGSSSGGGMGSHGGMGGHGGGQGGSGGSSGSGGDCGGGSGGSGGGGSGGGGGGGGCR